MIGERLGRGVLAALLLVPGAGVAAMQSDEARTVGPRVGSRVPGFTLPDQHGRPRSLDSLKGRRGTLLVFVRSADW